MTLITKLDLLLNKEVMLFWAHQLNDLMIFITDFMSPENLLLFSLLLLAMLILRKKWYHIMLFIVGMGGGVVLQFLLKFLIHRERPLNSLIVESGYSFPSGHAIMAIIFFGLLIYLFKDEIKNKILRGLFISGNIVMFLLVGLSRVYLNVHWFSDVIGGFVVGLIWLAMLIFIFRSKMFETRFPTLPDIFVRK